LIGAAERTIVEHRKKIAKVMKEIDELNFSTRGETIQRRNLMYKALIEKLKELEECQRIFLNAHDRVDRRHSFSRFFFDARERDRRMFENALPAYTQKEVIIQTLLRNKVFIVVGETGSGKSTQVPQYLAESPILSDLQKTKQMSILCTQPRPIAATSLAKRVEQEYVISQSSSGSVRSLGKGFKGLKPKKTRISFTTNAQLLNHIEDDPMLSRFSCVVIDEAHERSLDGDILMNFLKKLTVERDDFYLVITSATINEEMFQDYFGKCPVITINGRLHPVAIAYNEAVINERYTDTKVYRRLAIEKVLEITKSSDNRLNHGDLLVFLPSQEDCEKVKTDLSKQVPDTIELITLHGNSSDEDKDKAMGPIPGKRKVIISTNIAETSLTINGIVHVIDSGLAKEIRYDPKKNMESLELRMITKSSAKQRSGRAGRTQPGMCHRLYSNEIHKEMQDFPVAEIKRKHLAKSLLLIMSRGVENVDDFDFIERPEREAVDEATNLLRMMNALNHHNTLTPLGRAMAAMPTDPMVSRLVLEAASKGIANAAIQLGAMILCSSRIFRMPRDDDDLASKILRARCSFAENGGDLLNLLSIFRTFLATPAEERKDWVTEKCLSHYALNSAKKEAGHIQESLQRALRYLPEITAPSTTFDLDHGVLDVATQRALRRAVCAGFFQNVAQLHDNVYNVVRLKQRANINVFKSFPHTVDHKPEWIVFMELFSSAKNKDYVLMLSEIDRNWIEELAPEFSRAIRFSNLPSLVHFHEIIAPRTASMIIGPSGSNRYELQHKWDCTFSFSSDRVTVTVAENKVQRVQQELREYIARCEDEIINEVDIRNIMNARCVIGRGGQIDSILGLREFLKVIIHDIPSNCVRHELKREIEEICGPKSVSKLSLIRSNKDKKESSSAIVTFTKPAAARKAIDCLIFLSRTKVSVKPFIEDRRLKDLEGEERHALFVEWTTKERVPKICNGTAKVIFVDNAPIEIGGKQITVCGTLIKINRVKPNVKHIKLFGLPKTTTKSDIQVALRQITIKPIDNIIVYFEMTDHSITPSFSTPPSVPAGEDDKLDIPYVLIESIFHQYGNFKEADIIENSPGVFKTKILFDKETSALRAFRELNGREGVLGVGPLKARFNPRKIITLPHTDLVKRLSDDITSLITDIKGSEGIEISISKQRDIIEFKKKHEAGHDLHQTWDSVEKAVSRFRGVLLLPRFVGQICRTDNRELKKIMEETTTYIHLDTQRRIYSIYGKEKNTMIAEQRLNVLQSRGDGFMIEKIFNATSTFLSNFDKAFLPPAIERLNAKFKVSPGRLTVTCKAEHLDAISEFVNNFRKQHSDAPTADAILCDVCGFAELGVHSGSFLSCKHFVCDECLPNSLRNAHFKCGCGSPFALSDIFLAKYFDSKPNDLGVAEKRMLENFIAANKSTHGYCVECRDGVWKVQDGVARCLNPACLSLVCRTPDPRDDLDVDTFLRDNPKNFRKCPNPACGKIVEKMSGCNAIICCYCQGNFCWLCVRHFSEDAHNHFGWANDPCYGKVFDGLGY
jgi:HrpA-like RNA helicase